MGLSTRKGNGGFLGIDARRFITSSGIISERKARVERIDGKLAPVYPPETILDENFSSGDFSGWTVVNGTQPSKWIVSSGIPVKNDDRDTVTVPSGSTYVAFVSNDNTNNTYSNNSDVHFYIDFTIPDNSTRINLTLDWMCQGENAGGASSYDYGYIGFADTSFTPSAGSEYGLTQGTTYQRITNTTRSGFNANSGKFNCEDSNSRCPTSLNPVNGREGFVADGALLNGTEISVGSLWTPGATRRLILSWKSDISGFYYPSWTITNIKLISHSD